MERILSYNYHQGTSKFTSYAQKRLDEEYKQQGCPFNCKLFIIGESWFKGADGVEPIFLEQDGTIVFFKSIEQWQQKLNELRKNDRKYSWRGIIQ